MHPKNRTCERTEEVLENYRHRAIEAEAELVRHHRDFESIRTILDNVEQSPGAYLDLGAALGKIRNIVG